MATLSGTQKKQKRNFIIMLVALVLVIAAIGFVLFGGLTAKSKLMENQKFATAVADALGKAPALVTEADLASVKYLGLYYDSENKVLSGALGKDDAYVDLYNTLNAKTENEEEITAEESEKFTKLSEKNKTFEFKFDGEEMMDDLKYFTGLRIAEISSVKVTDSSVFAGMKSLENGTFNACGLTEVNGFAGLDAEKLIKLNITGNDIPDDGWTPLEYISDKVLVESYYTLDMGEDGNYNFVPVEKNLTDKLAEIAEAAAAEEEEAEETEGEEEAEETEATEDEEAEVTEGEEEAEAEDEAEAEAEEEVEAEVEAEVEEEAEAEVETETEAEEAEEN